MRYFLVFLLVLPLVTANSLVLYIDFLQPLDPDAKRGESADDFEASKRILASDFDRLLESLDSGDEELILEHVARVESSLGLVGELGGYTSGYYSNKHSQKNYLALVGFVEDIKKDLAPKEKPAPAPEIIRPVVIVDYRNLVDILVDTVLGL